ncbi:MAG: hypothetical protein DHS20C16_09150 [Phycisphaerae bacterium]|nr:MAG: hypothetical protein DHS20C16_09150 [Phycisphaerae bacterium]
MRWFREVGGMHEVSNDTQRLMLYQLQNSVWLFLGQTPVAGRTNVAANR